MGKKRTEDLSNTRVDLCEFYRYKHVAYFNVKVTLTKLYVQFIYS